VIQAVLHEYDVDTRSSHIERREIAWRRFLEDRIAFHGQSTAGQSYLDQQVTMSEIIARDVLPSRQVEVRRDQSLDLSLFGLG
jgi:hypothetical protein